MMKGTEKQIAWATNLKEKFEQEIIREKKHLSDFPNKNAPKVIVLELENLRARINFDDAADIISKLKHDYSGQY